MVKFTHGLASAARVVAVIWLATTMVFFALRLTPGDPAVLLLGPQAGRPDSAQRLEEIRIEYGLNDSLATQYKIFITDLLSGDLGESNRNKQPVTQLLAQAAPVTLNLILLSMGAAIPIAAYLGIVAARHRGRTRDRLIRIGATLGIAVPSFWVGLILLNFFAVDRGWLPPSGYVSPTDDLWQNIRHLAMPVATLTLFLTGTLTRFVYTETADVLEQDYISVARAMGLRRREVLFRFAAKNSLTPLVIVVGVELGALLGGAALIEEVFGLPGVGRLLLNAVLGRDYPVVQGIVVVLTVLVILLNVAAEFVYRRLSPQARE